MSAFKADIFKGKNAFIAGGTSGINLGIAARFAELGASVTVIGRDVDKARKAARSIGPETLGMSCDVRSYEAVNEALAACVSRFGAIDFLISGAAGNFLSRAEGLSSNAFRTVVDIDLIGTFNVFRAGYDKLSQPGASLIAITAGQAVNPVVGQVHACAAKAGINQMIRTLAMEWGPLGIRVNGISPGPINGTEGMVRLTPTEESRRALMSRIPLRRYGEIAEIADAATFLCSPAASYVTGTILDCEGGSQLGDARDRSF